MDNLNNNITTNQKIAVGLLLFFAVLVVFLWVIQFRSGLGLGREATQDNTVLNENSYSVDINKDTDGDGLSDADELNIYKTSPYLEDSDSDGFSDFEEVNSNNDPNCPIGRICTTAPIKNDLGQEFLNEMRDAEDLVNTVIEERPAQVDMGGILSGNSDAQTLRTSLINAGFDPEMLKQISDEDLLQAYKEILSEK
ncbi:hypothetical protein A2331_06680 [Candidatus Falkowbacteria bacterium RIFOXYB2_FULL_34_18]|uniref:Uncharacterized protein n=1 Tax=Candidatus Falkowbacteria bacterium RIFOXYD2_FULL_34_120 TaxID=1798007 RepID=A0A1F5TRR9_9BACT|nr:MAG: hypothetical protein A2331_06680 [Candidatus Falkowbacteria bacterium RIFOXYB2_FULL_34_18]OGF29994.1 MAG: hypothetical protein A2500_04000 [Candidatus Falkowbacteria bacterium RIFOXYC12_FULL_34_55]OGF37149.1 MAG: hypothetical protein A2466_02520 [Candidatus Falkowbacteria bacterium RIFOXYC2_FULL_34_220]OGF39530.1 MAG: hypothetical protein A2515_04365 [Candidatus Falkowbacteria bacterium RIFOXYD12_FULL_34_57]OGF41487.1 MAG: hypothetical protein A2531_02235 [Candidatus Falkowbacteria bact